MNQLCRCVFVIFLFISFYSSCTNNATGPKGFRSVNWPESTPERQGLNSQMLDAAFAAAGQKPFINGIVIIRNGFLVAESYFNGYNKDDFHNIRSVSKSFLSALIGIAIGHGGQFIISIPELQMIITTSSYSDNLSWEQADVQERAVLDVISAYVMPAVAEPQFIRVLLKSEANDPGDRFANLRER